MRSLTLIAIPALFLAATAPGFAQNAMMNDGMHSGSMAGMSAADTRMMHRCNAMSHNRMMRDKRCKRMMGMHPDMMHQGAMSSDHMMKSDR